MNDRLSEADRVGLGIDVMKMPMANMGLALRSVRAIPTGEFRPPRRGEWFLSGAKVEAYRAPNDLTCAYHIAWLVRVETVTMYVIVRVSRPLEAQHDPS